MVTVESLLLGFFFATVDGMQALVSPGMGTVYARGFPAPLPLALAVRFLVPWSDLDMPHVYTVDIVDEQGNAVWRDDHPFPGRPIPTTAPKDANQPFEDQLVFQPVSLGPAGFPKAAWYFVVVFVDGREQARTQIRVAPTP